MELGAGGEGEYRLSGRPLRECERQRRDLDGRLQGVHGVLQADVRCAGPRGLPLRGGSLVGVLLAPPGEDPGAGRDRLQVRVQHPSGGLQVLQGDHLHGRRGEALLREERGGSNLGDPRRPVQRQIPLLELLLPPVRK